MSCRWSTGAVGMRGSQQIVTPACRHAPSRLSCPLDCSQDQARPAAEAHTQSAAHSDLRCVWCATRSLYYAARANVTTLICESDLSGPTAGAIGPGSPRGPFCSVVFPACFAGPFVVVYFCDDESRGWCKVEVGAGVGVCVRTGVGTGAGVGVGHTPTMALGKGPSPSPTPTPTPTPFF